MASICELHKEEEVIVSASKQHFTFCTCAFLVIEYLKGNQVYTVTLPVEYTHSRGTTYEVETSTTLYIDEKIPEVSGTHTICMYVLPSGSKWNKGDTHEMDINCQ